MSSSVLIQNATNDFGHDSNNETLSAWNTTSVNTTFINTTAVSAFNDNTIVNTTALAKMVIDDDFISQQTSEQIIFALQCVVIPAVSALGVAGNVISLFILLQKTILNPTVILLLGLTVADCIFLIVNALRKATCIIQNVNASISNLYYGNSFIPLYYLTMTSGRVSTLLVVAISIERFVAVAFPLKVRLISTKFRMSVVVIIIYVFTFSFLSLMPAQITMKERGGRFFISTSNFYKANANSLNIYNTYVNMILFRWVPKLIVIVFNSIICFLISRRRLVNADTRNSNAIISRLRQQSHMTKMLVVVAAVFVVCLIPGDIFSIMTEVVDGFNLFGKYKYAFQAFSDLTILFEMINSSVNFIIYMALNKTFSETYFKLFCRCCRRNLSHRESQSRNINSNNSAYSQQKAPTNGRIYQIS